MVPSVLIVDDEKHTREGLQQALAENYDVSLAANADEAFNLMDAQPFDVVLTDLRMPGKSGLKVIDKALALPNQPAVLMMTAYGNIETAVEAMKRGAVDFLTKPVNIERLGVLIQRALKTKTLEVEVKQLHERLDEKFSFEGIIGTSARLKEVIDRVKLVAPSRATILIEGESGTGKELIAQAIHQASPRARAPFIAVHCASLSESLLESEIFGHERGSFTGATERRIGRFEAADGGTLFLDEIGEMEIGVQPKLLRFLETRRARRVGGEAEYKVQLRVISATNRNLEEEIAEKRFRADLYYRLAETALQIPPLRTRLEDIPELAIVFLKMANERFGKNIETLEPALIERFQKYNWPGNVRELKSAVDRLVLLFDGPVLRAQWWDVPEGGRFDSAVMPLVPVAAPPSTGLPNQKQKREQARKLLAESDNDFTWVAAQLGVNPSTLWRWRKAGKV